MWVNCERGFTLLEVLVAVILFSFVFLLFGAFFVNSFTISTKQDSEVVAINLARQVAEQWKSGNKCVTSNPSSIPVVCEKLTINERDYYPEVIRHNMPPITIITVNIYSSIERTPLDLLAKISLAED